MSIQDYSPSRVLGALKRRRKDLLLKFWFWYYSKKPLKNAVYFESFQGKVLADSPLAIGNEIANRRLAFDLYWAVADKSQRPPAGMTAIVFGSRSWIAAITTSRYLVNNNLFPWYFKKRGGQVYLQTWHGTPLKRLVFDIESDTSTIGYRNTVTKETSQWDALISPSEFATEKFRSAFRYTGEVLTIGYPRNDALVNVSDAQRQSLRRKLKVGEKEFMVLYAPTWRDYLRTAGGSWSSVNYMNDADSLPDGVKVFYRGHTNTQSADVDPSFHNVTSYPDIAELCIAADVLVTDYSSTMFDFAVTGKPMIAFVPDLERYRAERGFYFDFEAEFPGPIVTTTEELAAALSDVSTWVEFYAPKYQAWQQKYTSMDDGTAAVRAADWLLDPQRLTK